MYAFENTSVLIDFYLTCRLATMPYLGHIACTVFFQRTLKLRVTTILKSSGPWLSSSDDLTWLA